MKVLVQLYPHGCSGRALPAPGAGLVVFRRRSAVRDGETVPGSAVKRFRGLLVGLDVSVLAFGGVVPAHAPDPVTELHVFLAAGQSNMAGWGLPVGGDRDPADPRMFQYGSKARTLRPATAPLDMHDTPPGLSPATTLAREYLKTQAGNVGVLIIPAAHSGTAFTSAANTLTWSVGSASAPEFDLSTLAVTQTRDGIAAASAAGLHVELKGILWLQGESNSSMSTSEYSTRLDELIAFFRSRLAAPTLPFVVGGMTPEGIADTPSRANVDRSHRETPARVPSSGFAPPMTGGVNVDDRIHFSRAGVEFLGKTYLAGYWAAVAAGGSTSPPGADGGGNPAAAGTAIRAAPVANPGLGQAAAPSACGLPQDGAMVGSPPRAP
ncbi:sialate O-acetylesterase [Pseudarthrobacter oxydans]|uniref:sialate O-acetylesterase n=1 Tax=Pseudarthrobacter oxydans TaxID=1671 RepID=UPI0027D87FD1|nr:sialate O-acetylesterase [Pseudarthrobacter oxydans]